EATDGGPGAGRRRAPGGRDRGEQQRERGRQLGGRADRLHDPGDDQQAEVGGERAAERGDREDRDAGQEDRALPDPVAEASGEDEEGGQGYRVRVEHPAEVAEGGVEVAAEGGERDVDDPQV